MHQQLSRVFLGWLTVLGVAATMQADWPQYRGPNHDGSANTSIRTNWIENPPRVLWKVPLGPGWSSPVVAGGKLFTQFRQVTNGGNREFAVALDTETGQRLWSQDVERAEYSDLAGYDDALDGPRSTPTVDGDRVYVLTSQLTLLCLRADTGAVVWERNLVTELESHVIAWQNAASPLVIGDLLFLNSNAATNGTLMAVRKSDGTQVWRSGTDVLTHATPVYATLQGIPQVIFLTLSGLVGLVPETGAELWRFRFTPSSTSTAASPVVDGNYVYASAAYARGAWAAQVSRTGDTFSASQSWQKRADQYQNHWATPVARDGFLYSVGGPGPNGIQLVCIEMATGAIRWSQGTVGMRPLGFGSVQRVGDLLLVVNEDGELVLVKAEPSAYTELGVFSTELDYCWNNAAVTDGRVYLRDPAFVMAIDVAATPLPLPPLRLSIDHGETSETVELLVRAEDGTPLNDFATRIELRGTPSLVEPLDGWLGVPATWIPTATGPLESAIPSTPEPRFLRVQEKVADP